jgi:hypothetical protein
MGRKMLCVILVLAVAVFWGIASAGPNVRPGKWEITAETEIGGMPMSIPAVAHTQCDE